MRVLLADDVALLREGSTGLLTTARHEVMTQVTGADALRTEVGHLAAAGELSDVVTIDVRMPSTGVDDRLRAAIGLRRTYPGLPVVMLSVYVAGPYVQDLLEETESPTSPAGPGAPSVSSGGAVGYPSKERVGRVANFPHSLDIVMGGGVVIDPEVVSHLIKAIRATGSTQETIQMVTDCWTGEDVGTMVDTGLSTAPTAFDAWGSVPATTVSSSAPSGGIVNVVPGGAGPDRLTRRKQEVFELMAQGLSNTQIAGRLVISGGAVAKHVANVSRGLDLQPGEGNWRMRAVPAWLCTRA